MARMTHEIMLLSEIIAKRSNPVCPSRKNPKIISPRSKRAKGNTCLFLLEERIKTPISGREAPLNSINRTQIVDALWDRSSFTESNTKEPAIISIARDPTPNLVDSVISVIVATSKGPRKRVTVLLKPNNAKNWEVISGGEILAIKVLEAPKFVTNTKAKN